MGVKLESSWLELLGDQFEQDYFKKIKAELIQEKKKGERIFPPGPLIFNAFDSCPVEDTKVVIMGQDPYHNPGQAHGLSFSVPQGLPPPPSLVNIFKELTDDLHLPMPTHGNLESWAAQGVLLLNSSLTVRAFNAGSHFYLGWEKFTNTAIERLSQRKKHIVFMLWGNPARKKKSLIDPQGEHLILEAVHPSPLSAYRGFLGCRHFSSANDFLQATGQEPIDWQLPD
ncbi:MAG: uracil-DNA glycosylase [Fibrobacter sp.]|nr:uracil-DNA glycosylase [Fibrobacter sp.]